MLASSSDEGRTFSHVQRMPTGFVYVTAVNGSVETLPDDQRLGVYIFGVPRYRTSIPYLAYAPAGSVSTPSTWRFFVGSAAGGKPKWVTEEEWNRGSTSTSIPTRDQAWKPAGEPEIFAPASDAGRCIGEFSITWNRPLGAWLLLYNCDGIFARVAPAPWGPWSTPTKILGGEDDVACRLVMTPQGCGNRRDFWPRPHAKGRFVGGGFYAPFVLNRYTVGRSSNGPTRSATIYWLVSSWNPYEVTVMRTTLQIDPR